MKQIITSILGICMSILCLAQEINTNLETVFTKNGSQYEGYISEQIPGEEITVYAEKATIIVSKKEIQQRRTEDRQCSQLPPKAQEWSKAYGYDRFVTLSTLKVNDIIYDNAYIEDESDEFVKFVCFDSRSYCIPWNEVKKTERHVALDMKYGLKDILTLKNGKRFTGHITEQEIGKNLCFHDNLGYRNYQSDEILSILTEPIDPNTEIWGQTVLLDKIITRDGKTYEGLITSRVYDQMIYLKTRTLRDEIRIPLEEIDRYQKFLNRFYKEYNPAEADLIAGITYNFQSIKPAKGEKNLKHDKIIFNKDSVEVQHLLSGETVTISAYQVDLAKNASLYKLKKCGIKKKYACKLKKGPRYQCKIQHKENGTYFCEFDLDLKGLYYLSLSQDNTSGIVISIE